jgi:cytoskeletal protein CcmA (bactofilin family)
MPIPTHIQRRVAHIDVLTQDAFSRSVSYWRLGFGKEQRWSTVDAQSQPLLIGSDDALIIDCDSNALIAAPDGGVVHINGDLNADLDAAGLHEIVIRGDVSAQSTIRADRFSSIYIGGSVFGRIESQEKAEIWIDGNFSGSLATGYQSTELHISGNFNGSITSYDDDPSLLYLSVDGFAANKLISSIASIGYAIFNASVGASDIEPGLYPNDPGRRRRATGNVSQWCVLSRREEAEQCRSR